MSPKNQKSYRVLVVDDDPSVLATYRRLLCRQGYETHAADDPQALLSNGFDHGKVDLLLLDYKMPGMDGLSLLAELRRGECRARCILLSAFLNDDVRNQATNLGVDRVLEKPVGVRELRRVLDELLPLAKPQVAGSRKNSREASEALAAQSECENSGDDSDDDRARGTNGTRVTVAS